MSSSVPSVYIQAESVTEQQENIKNSRKRTLGVLQKTATDKENILVGRHPAYIAKEHLIKKTIDR